MDNTAEIFQSSAVRNGTRYPVKEGTLPPPIRNTRKYEENDDRNTIVPPDIIDG